MLNFETVFDVDEGNVGLPYVSNDIGGFLGDHLPDQLYVRWIQLGAFSPILRPHSNHGDRLPWDYPGNADAIASAFMRLRESLIPYTYTAARQSYDTGLPITRATYLSWPDRDDAYTYNHEYMFGPELLVAPVGTPGDPATKTVWFPPGTWVDIFTDQRFKGPAVRTLSVPLSQMPAFARAGAIVPRAPYMDYSTERPLTPLTLDVYAGSDGSFSLYEDAGQGFGYQHGQFSRTPMRWNQRRRALTIGPARGSFSGRLRRRAYRIELIGVRRPRAVLLGGRPLALALVLPERDADAHAYPSSNRHAPPHQPDARALSRSRPEIIASSPNSNRASSSWPPISVAIEAITGNRSVGSDSKKSWISS